MIRDVQCRNRCNNRALEYNGETLVLKDWAERLGINISTLHWRLARWPVERALGS